MTSCSSATFTPTKSPLSTVGDDDARDAAADHVADVLLIKPSRALLPLFEQLGRWWQAQVGCEPPGDLVPLGPTPKGFVEAVDGVYDSSLLVAVGLPLIVVDHLDSLVRRAQIASRRPVAGPAEAAPGMSLEERTAAGGR